jgi:hypothetical protein
MLPAPDYCNFPVQITFPDYNQYGIVRSTNADGTQTLQITGHATATVTNQATGKSVSYNISGPGTAVINPNTGFIQSADIAGPNLLWTARQNLQNFPKVPTISYTKGHLTFAVDPSSLQTTSYSLAGGDRQTDVCAALA